MLRHTKRKRSFPKKFEGFVIHTPIAYTSSESQTSKKRKDPISFFSEEPRKKRKLIASVSDKSDPPFLQQTLKDLGLEDMPLDSYIPSPLDKPDWVTVRKVSLLTNMDGHGLFARCDIPKGTCVGLYTGKEYSLDEFEAYLKENAEANGNYAMTIGEKIIDSSTSGNYTRYINFSDTQANVCFVAGRLQYQKVVKVITTTDIKAGQQFLVDYNVYDENASKHFYFLSPSDNWRSTEDLYSAYSYQTVRPPIDMPELDIKRSNNLLATNIGKAILGNKNLSTIDIPYEPEEINLPYLRKYRRNILRFEQADVFTPLMLACYLGQFENVRWLIDKGANINQQQHHSGNCPLFFALIGYSATLDNKRAYVEIIKLLINNKANLCVHDRTDKTFLHKAISTLDKEDFQAVMNVIKEQEEVNLHQLFSFIDENSDDILVHCLREKLFDHAKILLRTYPTYFKEYYMSGSGEDKAFNKEAFIDATKNYSPHERQTLFRLLQEQFTTARPRLFSDLGLARAEEIDAENLSSSMMM